MKIKTSSKIELKILATTDLHSYAMDYDYYRDEETEQFGLVRTASLIRKIRQNTQNCLLFDNGDLLQGSPMGTYFKNNFNYFQNKPENIKPNAIITLMNLLEYDAATLGNHEFNFGLPFLEYSLKQAKFQYVCTNIALQKKGSKTLLIPNHLIINKKVVDTEGCEHILRIGVLGVVPPKIALWDKVNLTQKHNEAGFEDLVIEDMVESVRTKSSELKSKNIADIVIVLSHSGFDTEKSLKHSSIPVNIQDSLEDCSNYLTEIKEVDAIISGHLHAIFPPFDLSKPYRFQEIEKIDLKNGLINQKPICMPGCFGKYLGIIDLELRAYKDQKNHTVWQVEKSRAKLEAIFDEAKEVANVQGEQDLRELIKETHQAVREFVNHPIGNNPHYFGNYLALVQGDPTIEIVTQAQKEYAEKWVKANPIYSDLPILSATAPFRAGGRKDNPRAFIEIKEGLLCYRHCINLYSFPNTIALLKITGEDIKEWLECAVSIFCQIDPQTSDKQSLVNWMKFRTYNFDLIKGLFYTIDLTTPARYNQHGKIINEQSRRITSLSFADQPIKDNDTFLMVTNNYRAFGEKFKGASEKNVIFSSADEIPDIVTQYVVDRLSSGRELVDSFEPIFRFDKIKSTVPLDIQFETANSYLAHQYICHHSLYPVENIGTDEQGFAIYRIHLQ